MTIEDIRNLIEDYASNQDTLSALAIAEEIHREVTLEARQQFSKEIGELLDLKYQYQAGVLNDTDRKGTETN